jgi:uncharacterized protein YjbI with pentapeptide repeats
MKSLIFLIAIFEILFCNLLFARASNPDDERRLRDTNSCPKCDLSGSNLSGANLKGADKKDANLSGAILSGASQ